jgi:signal transduction histidine kinase
MKRKIILDQASTLLANCLDYEATIQKIVELVTSSDLASWSIVDVVGEDGKIQRVAAAHTDPAKMSDLHRLCEKYPARPTAQRGVYKVIETGKSIMIPKLTTEMLQARADDDEHYRLVEGLGHRSYMCVPLIARGHTIGTILLYSGTREYDETDLKLAEELALRSALAVDNARMYRKAQEAIALRDEFLAVAAHELRSPLTPLKAQPSIIKKVLEGYELKAEDSARILRCLDSSEREVDRLARLLNQLMDVSRLHCERMELDLGEVELTSLAGEVLRRFQIQLDKAACRIDFEPTSPVKGIWDRFRLDQVINNLVSNAIKHAPGAPIRVSVSANESHGIFRIQDEGPGIEPADQSRIFELFERANPRKVVSGLGLGLYISRTIIEAHGGRITVESTPGRGSAFSVFLPIA